ncbi:IBR domain [Trinorchestia longiramus]|nr:IBR domain [Trinorchestia longiramus]
MATAGPLIINLGTSNSPPPPSTRQQSPPHPLSATITQFRYNNSENISTRPTCYESSPAPASAPPVDQKFACAELPSFHKLLAGSKSVPTDSRVLDFREVPPVPVHHLKSPARPVTNVSQAFSEGVTAPAYFSQFSPSGVCQNRFVKPFSPSSVSSRNGSLSPVSPANKSLSPSTSPLNKSFSPVKSPLNKSFSPVKSTPFHNPLCAQRSSPSLHRPGTRTTVVGTPPKSPLFASASSRKLSCPKISRVSPTQFKFQQYQYSKVPKSDSAFSEDIYAYSPISRGYSPSLISPVSPPKLKSSRTQDSGISYPFILHKSESSYSEQNVPCRSTSGLPKSRSTIFRSDSAYSDIEYSYSTIPQSESFCLEEEYAYLSLPKSDSTYSENILTYSKEKQGPIQRSLSSCSHQFAGSFSPPECDASMNEEKGASFCRSVIGRRGRYRSLSHTSSPRLSQSQVVDSSSATAGALGKTYHSSSSSPNFIMPTLKSIFKIRSRQSVPGKASRYEKTPKKSFVNRGISAHNLSSKAASGGASQHSIKKSHTVLALSSNVATNYSASTKLLASGDDKSPCKIHRCLSKTLLKSISQTLNSSIGQNLNKSDAPCPPRKRSRRRSQLSAFLPRSLSRASSIAPSVASAGASYLGSYIGSLGSGEGDTLYCRLCLMDVSVNMMCQLTLCQCRFCRYCMSEYTRVKILEGEHCIECPDGSCDAREDSVGELTAEEIEALVGKDLLAQRNKLKLNAEVIADPFRVFCPQPGCDTIIRLNRPKFNVLDSDVPPQPKSDASENITLTIPKIPLKVPAENPRTRRVGTTVNLYMKNQPETSLRTETALVELNKSVVGSSPDRVPSSSRSSDQTPHSSDRLNVTSENDLTSIKNVETNITLEGVKVDGSSSREMKCSNDAQSEEESLLTERKISLDEVNMIKDIKRPKILPLTSSPRPQRLAEYPADPDLSAAMAALQSPADYRPFAALAMPPEAVEYRALQGIPEVPDAEGMSSEFGVICPTCQLEFCPSCGQNSHPNGQCQLQLLASSKGIKMQYKKLMGMDNSDLPGVIKCCPNPKCQVAIERNEGCAQMQCRACKHTFCWYCLASLEEDFLLRHYDKGPCRNKLGHSRASVLCHRLQVIAIFLSVGLLVFAAAPLLVLVGPCVLCCKCKLDRDTPEDSPDEN